MCRSEIFARRVDLDDLDTLAARIVEIREHALPVMGGDHRRIVGIVAQRRVEASDRALEFGDKWTQSVFRNQRVVRGHADLSAVEQLAHRPDSV